MGYNFDFGTINDKETGISMPFLQAKANQVTLRNLTSSTDKAGKFLYETSYYGINASFFDFNNGYACIQNIAYQNGKCLGAFGDYGKTNEDDCGTCVLIYNGSRLLYSSSVKDPGNPGDGIIPKEGGT